MQCILQANTGDSSDKELEMGELDEILVKLKESVQSDPKQAAVWNTLGLILLRTNRLQVLMYFCFGSFFPFNFIKFTGYFTKFTNNLHISCFTLILFSYFLQSAISVLSSLLAIVPDYLDSLANLGIAYLQRCDNFVNILKLPPASINWTS